MQGPVQPLCVQQVLLLKHVAPPEQLQGCETPQLSATDVLHKLPHWFTAKQHEPAELHSWPAAHPPVHCTVCPQLFVTVKPPQCPEQGVALSGEQQALL
jgi:hypothetical protein